MKRLLLLVVPFLCAQILYAQRMMFGDTSRVGRPYSKDPVVVPFGGRYLMYFSMPPKDFDSNTSQWIIGIAESHNLIDWKTIARIEPHPDAPYEQKGLCAPGAYLHNDTIHLFYQTYGNGKKDAICHATSTDGVTFHRDPTNPIFSPQGDWTCGRAIDAEVAFFNDTYFLYFATRTPDFDIQLQGVATAPAGTRFSRDEWTQACDSSILKPELPWEGKCIEGATICHKNGRMYMFYAADYNNKPQQIGVAVSTDGIKWERLFDKPFIPVGGPGSWNSSESGHPCIFTDTDGRTYLFYQGNNDNGKTWYITQEEIFWNDNGPYRKPAP